MTNSNKRRKSLIQRVSKHTDIRTDVVEIILNGFIDIAVEDIVNEGSFGIRQLFEISSAEWNGYAINSSEIVPKHVRLKIKLSRAVRELWKARFSDFDGAKGAITKDNWKTILRNRNSRIANARSTRKQSEQDDNYNPFIDDDD